MFNLLPMLIQLSETDKRIFVALCIVLIIAFVLVAYIGKGVASLMRKHAKRIDGYMYDLCRAGLVKTPKDFFMQVLKREIKHLYIKTRWAFRITLSLTAALIMLAIVLKLSGPDKPLFAFYGESLHNLLIILDWPRGTFFGIENFIVDWPTVARWPEPKFNIASIVTYLSLIGYAYAIVVFFNNIVGFIGKLLRANEKSKDVFAKDLDEFKVEDESFKSLDNLSGTDLDGE